MRTLNHAVRSRRVLPWALGIAVFALAFSAHSAAAQNEAGAPPNRPPRTWQTFYLVHATAPNTGMEITTDLRNVIQHCCVSLIRSENAITVYGTADDLQLARQIISDLDRPSQSWRLTYTLTQTGGAHPGTQHLSVIVASGSKTELHQGTRVPIVTGAYGKETLTDSTQVQYVDIGLGLSAGLEGTADDLGLHTKIELTSLSADKSGIGAQDPVIRETALEAASNLTPGKSLALGSLDLPGTNGHEEVSVTVEPVS